MIFLFLPLCEVLLMDAQTAMLVAGLSSGLKYAEQEATLVGGQRALRPWLELIALFEVLFVTTEWWRKYDPTSKGWAI